MIKIILAVFILLSLLIDLYVYVSFLKKHKHIKLLGLAYFSIVFLAYVAVISVVAIRNLSEEASHGIFITGMWLIWFFVLITTPKLLFVFVSWPDIVISAVRKRKFRFFTYLASLLAVVSIVLIIDGALFGRRMMRVERVELEYSNLPSAFDGFKVVQFSDAHIGTMINSETLLNRMVDSINSLNPDIVIQSGDLVNLYYTELTPQIKSILSRIESRYGVFAVYGNHDLGFYVKNNVDYAKNIDEIKLFQESMGWTLLNNESVSLHINGDSITISGINFPADLGHNGFNSTMGGLDLEATYRDLQDSVFNITISHAPQLWGSILEEGRGDLVLAGHVHTMQSKVSIGKWKWSPAQYMYKQWSGLYNDNGRYLYINDGIGCVMYPMRVGDSRPEVTLIELKKAP